MPSSSDPARKKQRWSQTSLRRRHHGFRPRWRNSFACSVTEKSLNSQELEWRPLHMSLPLVLRRCGPCMLDRVGLADVDDVELWLPCETWRGCCGRCGG